MAFQRSCAPVGIHLLERPISHYNSINHTGGAVIDNPAGVNILTVLNAWKR